MWRLLAFFILCDAALGLPAPAMAQTQQPSVPPADYGFGPWLMWGGGWSSFWWICPLIMLAMILAIVFACRFMCAWHRD
jgi:hypothetical protein